jgi:hypothetical protein
MHNAKAINTSSTLHPVFRAELTQFIPRSAWMRRMQDKFDESKNLKSTSG